MARLDLDARRNARRAAQDEHAGDPHTVVFNDEEFTVPAEQPASFILAVGDLQNGDIAALRTALDALLGDQVTRFLAAEPSMPDLQDFIVGVTEEIYGVQEGKSAASPPSSKAIGARSRRTGKGSTTGTSLVTSGGPPR